MKPITPAKLNIGEGHHLDLIKVANPTQEDFTVYRAKQPFTIQTGKERILLRYIAKHFGKYLADRIISRKAEADDKPVIHYLSERLEILNSILIEVVEPHVQVAPGERNIPPEQVLKKGETALDIGRRSTLNELGIPDTPPVSSKADVAQNIVTTGKPPKSRSPMAIKKDKDKLVARAKTLGIKVKSKWSLERIKKTILEG